MGWGEVRVKNVRFIMELYDVQTVEMEGTIRIAVAQPPEHRGSASSSHRVGHHNEGTLRGEAGSVDGDVDGEESEGRHENRRTAEGAYDPVVSPAADLVVKISSAYGQIGWIVDAVIGVIIFDRQATCESNARYRCSAIAGERCVDQPVGVEAGEVECLQAEIRADRHDLSVVLYLHFLDVPPV